MTTQTGARRLKKVLIFRNIDEIHGRMIDGLDRAGFATRTTQSISEARRFWMDWKPSVVIIEVARLDSDNNNMGPGYDFVQILSQNREEGPPGIIVFSRLRRNSSHDAVCHAQGANRVLGPNLDMQQLLTNIQEVIDFTKTDIDDRFI